MTTIYNISPDFLRTYINYNGKKKLSMEEVFKSLSFELGGDGKTITKKQLDNYINNAESGLIKVDKAKLHALKKIQENWDNISKGQDQITYEGMKNFSSLLIATLTGNFTETEIEDSKSPAKDAIYDYLIDYYGLSDKSQIQKSDLTSYLNELITDTPENTDSNNELIGVLTNLIASYSPDSTVETEA